MELLDDTRLRPTRELPGREVAGETVVVDPRGRRVFVMNKVGAAVWEAARREASLGEIVQAVVARFQVDDSTARADVGRFVAELEAAGLVELVRA